LFFPLIWGAVWLIADPFVYRRRPEWSLLHDLTQGELGRIARLMLGGLAIGLLWEFYNAWARGKWIYTVPWLEHLKLFEMPPFGFVGFPFFALEAWSLYHALCVLRVAVPVESAHRHTRAPAEGRLVHPGRTLVAATLAVAFTVATLLGMERWTISSVVPTLEDLPGITTRQADRLRDAGISSPFELAHGDPNDSRRTDETDPAVVGPLRETAQLVTLRGIGARHAKRLVAVGIPSVCELARREPATLWASFHGTTVATHSTGLPVRPTTAEVRVWVRAARQQCQPR
jgi:predicted flap endonuclease-1-like 5' DNA nuclease